VILTVISSRSDRAPTRRTVDARLGKCILIVPDELLTTRELYRGKHFLVRYRQKGLRFCDLVRDVNERLIAKSLIDGALVSTRRLIGSKMNWILTHSPARHRQPGKTRQFVFALDIGPLDRRMIRRRT
jgi:hypothetical protein